jgi:5-methylcytosine-specific restriction endonuclease McrA
MPTGPRRPCTNPMCASLQPCPRHQRKPYATATRTSNLYSTARWKRERAAFLSTHPRCPCGTPANTVDHEPPHRGNEQAFYDRARFVAMCWPCHQRKTGRETRERVAAR